MLTLKHPLASRENIYHNAVMNLHSPSIMANTSCEVPSKAVHYLLVKLDWVLLNGYTSGNTALLIKTMEVV